MATVSAVMPNYNHARLIPEAIACLRAQTRPYDEIVVVDDGSTDDSVAVIEGLAAADPRIRLIRHELNAGAVTAINTGLHAARGDLLHFAAADDRFRPALLARLAALLDAHPETAFACAEVQLTQRATGRGLGIRPPVRPAHRDRAFTPAETRDLLARMDNFVVTAAAVFRRAPIVAAGGFDPRLGPFTDGFLVRVLALRHGFCFTPAVLAEWRVDDAGYSRSSARDPDRALPLLRQAMAAMAEDPAFPAWYPALFERRYRFAVARLAVGAEPVDFVALARLLPSSAAPWLAAARRMPSAIARPALLAGLALGYRPASLPGLAAAALARRAGLPRQKAA